MSKTDIIPFGKYKGQPVEVLQQDENYCQWLQSQDFVREKFPQLHTLIINNLQAPTETPEHNRIQVKFLSEDYRKQFFLAWYGGIDGLLKSLAMDINFRTKYGYYQRDEAIDAYNINVFINQSVEHIEKAYQQPKRQAKKTPDYVRYHKQVKEGLKKIIKMLSFEEGIGSRDLNFEVGGSDVSCFLFCSSNHLKLNPVPYCSFFIYMGTGYRRDRLIKTDNLLLRSGTYEEFRIEIKPVVSDDFPAVLRQMNHQRSNVLFLEKYTGTGATKEQFIDFFAAQNIKVMFASEVEAIDLDDSLKKLASANLADWID